MSELETGLINLCKLNPECDGKCFKCSLANKIVKPNKCLIENERISNNVC